MELAYNDGIPHFQKNECWWHVYEGDIRRAPIPLWQHAWNLFWNIAWKLHRIPAPRYYRGEVLNKKVAEFYGTNTVVTLGKQIMMDRLYGLSGPPAAVGNMGVGTDPAASAVTDTKLNPVTAGSVLFQAFDAGTSRTGQTVTAQSTFGTSVANFNWQECGEGNSNTNDGTHLFNRIAPIGAFNKTSAVSIIVIIAVTAN